MSATFHTRTSNRGTPGRVTINFELTLEADGISATGQMVQELQGEVERAVRAAATTACKQHDVERASRIEAFRTALDGVDPAHRRELAERLGVDPADFDPRPVLRTGERLIG